MDKKHKSIIELIMIILLLVFTFNIKYTNMVFAKLPPDMHISKQVVTNDNAIILAECYNGGRNIDKIVVDLYEGKKEEEEAPIASIEKKVDINVSNIKMLVNVQKDMGIVLKQGEQYYLDVNAITIYGSSPSYYRNSSLFTTTSAEIAGTPQGIEENNAILRLKIVCRNNEYVIKAGVRVTCFGCIVGIIEKDINQQTDNLSIDFDLKNEGKMSLLSNCNYQYNAYVVTKSLSGWKNEGRVDCYGAFKTLEGTSLTKGINKITKRNVIIRGNLLNPRGKTIEKYGVVIKKGRKVIGRCEKICPASEQNAMRKQLKFNIRKDSKKIKLLKGKKYRYEVYSYVGGEKYTINGRLKVTKNIIKR